SPRRAEDIDLRSGTRRPAVLEPSAFQLGCPQLSPSGRSLLFTASDTNGMAQIWLSEFPDGHEAGIAAPGFEPLWMPNGQEFLYSIDAAHAAVFSLPTAAFTLLPHPGATDDGLAIVEKAVSQKGEFIALLLVDQSAEYRVAIHRVRDLERLRAFRAPAARRL